MVEYIKSIIYKSSLNIMYLDYIYNVNTEQNLDLLKNEIYSLIDRHKSERTCFNFNVLKLVISKKINYYEYMYPKYASYFENFRLIIKIQNNDTFVEEFKMKINSCDDLFVLYLFFDVLSNVK